MVEKPDRRLLWIGVVIVLVFTVAGFMDVRDGAGFAPRELVYEEADKPDPIKDAICTCAWKKVGGDGPNKDRFFGCAYCDSPEVENTEDGEPKETCGIVKYKKKEDLPKPSGPKRSPANHDVAECSCGFSAGSVFSVCNPKPTDGDTGTNDRGERIDFGR